MKTTVLQKKVFVFIKNKLLLLQVVESFLQ